MKRRLAALAIPVGTVVVLVLAYRFSAPRSGAGVVGDRPGGTGVLQVGALPVT